MRLILAFCLVCLSQAVAAQGFPQRSVRVVVPFAPGGVVDTVARAAASHFEVRLGQPFVVENKDGAGGSIGGADVARAEPDGHTLLFTFDTHATAAELIPSLPYDPVTSFEPIALVLTSPLVMVARPDLQASDFNSLIELAGDQSIAYASVGRGSLGHVAFEELSSRHGVTMTHVPYRGATPALSDLMGGHADVMLTTVGTSLPFVQGGKLKPITVLSDARSKAMPDLTSIKEQTGESYEMISWVGFLGPAGTPAPVVTLLNEELRRAFDEPVTRERFLGQGFEIVVSEPAAFEAFLLEQRAEVGGLIRKFGLGAS